MCVCVLICRHVYVLLHVSCGEVYMHLRQCIYLFIGMYLYACVNLLHCVSVSPVVFTCLHVFLSCVFICVGPPVGLGH